MAKKGMKIFETRYFGLIIGVLVAWMIARWADRRMAETGEQFPAFWTGVGAVAVLETLTRS